MSIMMVRKIFGKKARFFNFFFPFVDVASLWLMGNFGNNLPKKKL